MRTPETTTAQQIIDRVGTTPEILQRGSMIDVLTGTDYLCRALHMAARHILHGGPPETARTGIVTAYANLSTAGRELADHTQLATAHEHHSPAPYDYRCQLAAQAEYAQYVASCLSARFAEFSPSLRVTPVLRLGMDAVRAVAAWKGSEHYVSHEPDDYMRQNLQGGLQLIDRNLW